ATERVRRAERIVAGNQVVVDAQARRVEVETKRGKPFKPVANVTDPESRLQKTRGGFIQGYNAQSVVSGDQVVIACDVTPDSTDTAHLVPMLEQSRDNLATAGVTSRVDVALADAGYACADNFGAEPDLGMTLLIATSKQRTVKDHQAKAAANKVRDQARIDVFVLIKAGDLTRREAADRIGLGASWTGILYNRWCATGTLDSPETLAWQAMTNRLAEPDNKVLYKKRSPLIEGSYAHIKTQRRTDSFTRHGLTACRAEWILINIVGNLMKLHKKVATSPTGPRYCRSRPRSRPINAVSGLSHRFSTRNRPLRPVRATTPHRDICHRATA
ncbi:MAG: transposase, partial [Acidimicrobiia bacterium]